jgi:hypothetical protein
MKYLFSLLTLGLTCLCNPAIASDVLTNRNDNARSGLVSDETVLTPASVPGLKLLFQNRVDSAVYAQPLCVHGLFVSQGWHDVLFVATENDSVYAFDALTGTMYWQASVLTPGYRPVSASDPNVLSRAIKPLVGITATPVIDRSAGPNGRIFVLAMETDGSGHYDYKLHALDLATGQDALTPVTIAATYGQFGPATTFLAQNQLSRAGLLLANGIIYTSFASFGDRPPYAGWLIGYRESDLSQASVIGTNPNGSPASTYLPDGSGGGIWSAGVGPSADSTGNVYLAVGNGPFDPASGDFGNSLLKLSPTVSDYFTPSVEQSLANKDEDFGASTAVLLPNLIDSNGHTHSLAVVVCKNSTIYLVDRNNLGKFNGSGDTNYQTISKALGSQAYSSPVFFNNSIYLCGDLGPLVKFNFDFSNPNQPLLIPTPVAKTPNSFGKRGCNPSISANGMANGIVWAYDTNLGAANAVLHAYDALTLTELFNSGTLLHKGVKFVVPTIFLGKVYVGTQNSIAAFGL